MDYGAYLTPEKLIQIELPVRHHDSARHNREIKRAKADLLSRNLRHYIDQGAQRGVLGIGHCVDATGSQQDAHPEVTLSLAGADEEISKVGLKRQGALALQIHVKVVFLGDLR